MASKINNNSPLDNQETSVENKDDLKPANTSEVAAFKSALNKTESTANPEKDPIKEGFMRIAFTNMQRAMEESNKRLKERLKENEGL